MRNTRVAILAGCIGCILLVFLPPNADVRAAVRAFGFGDREIYEFKDDTSRLHLHDLNGDGYDDVVFLNNPMSRIEVLIRKPAGQNRTGDGMPALEDAFDSAGFLLDQKTFQLDVLDLNGDQRPDIFNGRHASRPADLLPGTRRTLRQRHVARGEKHRAARGGQDGRF